MTTAAVIGLNTGKRLLSSSFYYSDLAEKLPSATDHHHHHHSQLGGGGGGASVKSVIIAKKSSNHSSSFVSNRQGRSVKALKDATTVSGVLIQRHNEEGGGGGDGGDGGEGGAGGSAEDFDYQMDAILLLQKSMLEKQWNLSADRAMLASAAKNRTKMGVTGSGTSARRRRIDGRKKSLSCKGVAVPRGSMSSKGLSSPLTSADLLRNRLKGYVKGVVSEELLSHSEVVQLSNKIKNGLFLEEQRNRLKQRLGCEPSEDQLASSLKITRADLQSELIECSLARERLAMSNVRLVISIAQRYDNMGAEMADLVQGGLIGLLRGIEKFDSSKGIKISTYVYWWIRQGVSKALVESSRTLRLPTHVHERLSLIRNAKNKLEERGITPSVDRIAESLNMSQKKVRNATEAISKVFSLDREAFPSLNGLPGETLHSYIADNHVENNPWHGVDGWALKAEVNKLINSTLVERERDIIRLYYGLDHECLTWEDISRRIGLSRERVRQVGLVALEKLKHAARKTRLEAMLVKH